MLTSRNGRMEGMVFNDLIGAMASSTLRPKDTRASDRAGRRAGGPYSVPNQRGPICANRQSSFK